MDFELFAFEANLDVYMATSIEMLNGADQTAFSPALLARESAVKSLTFSGQG